MFDRSRAARREREAAREKASEASSKRSLTQTNSHLTQNTDSPPVLGVGLQIATAGVVWYVQGKF